MFSVLLLATLSLFSKLIYSGVWLSLSLPTQIISEVQTTTDRKAKIQTPPECLECSHLGILKKRM